MENKEYEIVKTIPLKGGASISAGQILTKTHGVFYLNGGMLPKAYQEDFRQLVFAEENNGWNYLVPITQRAAFLKN